MTVGHRLQVMVAQIVKTGAIEGVDVDPSTGGIVAGLIDLAIVSPAGFSGVVRKEDVSRPRSIGDINAGTRGRSAAIVRDSIDLERNRRRGPGGESQFRGQRRAAPEIGRAGGAELHRAAGFGDGRVRCARFKGQRIDAPLGVDGVVGEIVAGDGGHFGHGHVERIADTHALRAGQNELRYPGRHAHHLKRCRARPARREIQRQAAVDRALRNGNAWIETFHRDGGGVGRIERGRDRDRHRRAGLTARRDDVQRRRLDARQRADFDVIKSVDQPVADPLEREVVAAETGLLNVTDVGPAADLHLRPIDEHRDGCRADALEVGCLRFNPHREFARR